MRNSRRSTAARRRRRSPGQALVEFALVLPLMMTIVISVLNFMPAVTTRGVVLDAAASEITDAALDWIAGYFDQILRRERKRLLHARYSAGYGDLLLENQRTMHRLLTLEKIGVTITESCILIPEKSVTAITGIRQSS